MKERKCFYKYENAIVHWHQKRVKDVQLTVPER